MTATKSLAHRDISWLSFNYRVLQEAEDPRVPLFDRVKFLAIYSSNLDEFFRVRVAHLQQLARIKKKKLKSATEPAQEEVLAEIQQIVRDQLEQYGSILRDVLYDQLAEEQVVLYRDQEVAPGHQQDIRHYFLSRILSYLQPVILNAKSSKKPFLKNRALYLALTLKRKRNSKKTYFGLVNIPSSELPRFIQLEKLEDTFYFIYLDDVIRQNLDIIFPGFEVLECVSLKLNRDADLQIADEYTGDLVEKIASHLAKRNIGAPSRFLYDGTVSSELLEFLTDYFNLGDGEQVAGGRYHNLHDLMSFPNPVYPRLSYEPMPPLPVAPLEQATSLFKVVEEEDLMLHFPYESYDYVLRFFNEAAIDPKVREIKVTLYRIAANSFIANALISAAQNGKNVTAFVELKARFDEENNLRWAQRMEEAGVKLIYSLPGLKVHAKVALIRRKRKSGDQYFGYYGTGNFNEKTAGIYADHALFTTRESMNRELEHVFSYLDDLSHPGEFNELLVSQFNVPDRYAEMIQREIRHQKSHGNGRLIVKVNNLEDPFMIEQLNEAAAAGVRVDLIIRGICRLMPAYPTIRIVRLVDRYLEHARIFWFANQGDDELYLASSDWMVRNLYHRVEVGFPIYQKQAKTALLELLQLQLNDNTKAAEIREDGSMQRVPVGVPSVRAQVDFYQWLGDRRLITGEVNHGNDESQDADNKPKHEDGIGNTK